MNVRDIIAFTCWELGDRNRPEMVEYAGIVQRIYRNGQFIANIGGSMKRFERSAVVELTVIGTVPERPNKDVETMAVVMASNRRFSIPWFRVGYGKPGDIELFIDWRMVDVR